MAINPLQLPPSQPINSLVDWSPLERLVQNWQMGAKEAEQNEAAYRDVGGGQGQPQQGGGFFADLGRRFGLIPEQPSAALPGTPPTRAPVSPSYSGGGGGGIGTMTPNAQKWFDYAIRPVADGGLGLSHAQAAGKVANLQAESGADINPVPRPGDKGTAHYAAQWREKRLDNLHGFAAAKGLDPRATETQQAFMRHEYLGNDAQVGNQFGGGSEGKAYSMLTATNTPERAAAAVDQFYERSSGQHRKKREAGAALLARSAGAPVVARGGPEVPPYNALDAQADQSSAWTATPRMAPELVPPSAGPGAQFNALDEAAGAPTDSSAQSRVYTPPTGAVPPLETREVRAAPVVAADQAPPEARAVENLTSGAPVAAAGFDRETIARMYRNPATRPLASALLQKHMDPGAYTYQQVGDRLMALHNKDPRLNKVIAEDTKPFVFGNRAIVRDANAPDGYRALNIPEPPKEFTTKEGETRYVPKPTGGYDVYGGEGGSKIQREVDQRRAAATASGSRTPEEIETYALTGKFPKEDKSATEIKETEKADQAVYAAHAAIKALDKSVGLSEKAFQGYGAGALGTITANAPKWFPGHEAGVATRALENQQLRAALEGLQAAFGRNPSNREDQIMIKLQGAVDEPIEVRREIFKEAREIFKDRLEENSRVAEQMHSGAFFKKGGTAAPVREVPPAPDVLSKTSSAKTSNAKPSLGDFMKKARDANPGTSDAELARYWKQKYGG